MKVVAPAVLASLLLALVPAVALAADGDVDPSFGASGRVVTDIGGDDAARAAVVQPDGKLLVAGSTAGLAGGDFVVERLDDDGTPDPSFGTDGLATVDFGGVDAATALALLPDGRIVVAGSTDAGATTPDPSDFAIAVLKPDGTPSTAFSGDGKQTVEFGADDHGTAVAVDGAGRILAGGWTDDGSASKFAIVRLNQAGLPDIGFGTGGGEKLLDFGGSSRLAGLVTTSGDRILAVGRTVSGPTPDNMAVAQLDDQGVEDPAFSGDGRQVVDFGGDDGAEAVTLRPDGAPLIAGTSDATNPDFAVLALQPDGDLDTTFSADGKQTLSFGSTLGGSEFATSIALTSTGKIAVGGRTDAASNPDQFAVALLDPDGPQSSGFSSNGKRTIDFGDADDEAYAVAARANRIYLAGSSGPPAGRDFAVAALEGGGPRVAVRDAAARETAGSVAVNLTLNAASNVPVSVRVTTLDGTARAGKDYTAVDTTVTFPPGTTAQAVAVPLIDDRTLERLEAFQVLLGSPSEAGLGRALASVRINSDEVDRHAPRITRVRVRPKAFKPSRRALVRWTLSERASVLLNFERARPGRAKARRFDTLVGRRVTGRKGTNNLSVKRRIAGRRLLPGRYRVILRATDPSGNRSKRARVPFRVKR